MHLDATAQPVLPESDLITCKDFGDLPYVNSI